MLRKLILIVIVITFFSGCGDEFDCENLKLAVPFQVKPNFLYQDCPGQLSITMLRVENDSRCPLGVICVWEGNAEVLFLFRNGADQAEISLDTNVKKPNGISETIALGHLIQLNTLDPYPNSKSAIKQKDYRAVIVISKVIFD